MLKGEALPARPNLEYLKKLAKQQVAALRRQGLTASLAAAQLTLARKYGFPSWRKLKAHVELSERAAAAVEAISSGDTKTLKRLLREDSNLANTRIDDKRTLLHVATDWPGHFPNNTETIAELIASGADVNAEFVGRHSETPLHWAASSDDVGAIDVLLDHGANIEARGSVIGDGTAMSDAVAFGQWQAARRLVERGAQNNPLAGRCFRIDGSCRRVFQRYSTAGAGRDHQCVLVRMSWWSTDGSGIPSQTRCRFELDWIRWIDTA